MADTRSNGSPPMKIPAELTAEHHLVGGLLVAPSKLGEVFELAGPRDLHHPLLQRILAAMDFLREDGVPIDTVTLEAHLRDRGELWRWKAFDVGMEGTGFQLFCHELAAAVVTVENLAYYAKMVREAARARRAQQATEAAQAQIAAGDLEKARAQLEHALKQLGPAAADSSRLLPTLTVDEIPEPGPITYLIHPLWTENAFGILGALPKSWKTYFAFQFAVSVATGNPLFGQFKVNRTGRVLIFCAEGGKKTVRRRIGAICRAMEIELRDLDIVVIDLPVMHLDNEKMRAQFLATVAQVKPVLVILDPLRELHTGDENDSAYIAELLAPIRTLQEQGVAVMLSHHMIKPPVGVAGRRRPAELLRGSGALAGAVDSAIFLEAKGEAEHKRVTVSVMHRDAQEPESFVLRMRVHSAPVGEAIWLEVAAEEDEAQAEERALDVREKMLAKIQRAILLASGPGRTPLNSTRAICFALKMSSKTVGPLLRDLLESGRITREKNGDFRPVVEGGDDG